MRAESAGGEQLGGIAVEASKGVAPPAAALSSAGGEVLDEFARANARVMAMEVALAYSPSDYAARPALSPLASGFAYSGSYAGRNIEKIHRLGGLDGSLEAAVRACFAAPRAHVLVCSGFYVLHSFGGNDGSGAMVAPGSCETDGPLGALALVRAFAARGVKVSLYAEPHNGPVMRAGYTAMIAHFAHTAPAMAELLRAHSRCLPDAEVEEQELASEYAKVHPGEMASAVDRHSLRYRALHAALALRHAVVKAWGGAKPPAIDTLFALERLGAPYRNIRGHDIGEHTEAIDALWALAQPPAGSASAGKLEAYAEASAPLEVLRAVAGVEFDALTLGIGDGGNEVGLGKVVLLDELAELSPGGEFAALGVNGTYRTCDHCVVGTVSNWAGTAFEAAAEVLFPLRECGGGGCCYDARAAPCVVEELVLEAIMAQPAGSVDGKYNESPKSVDGMAWEPYHREFYEEIWRLADGDCGDAN